MTKNAIAKETVDAVRIHVICGWPTSDFAC